MYQDFGRASTLRASANVELVKAKMSQKSIERSFLKYGTSTKPCTSKVVMEATPLPMEGGMVIGMFADPQGNVIAWESAGSAGFKGSRKSTPFAAQVTADNAARKGMEHGLERVEVAIPIESDDDEADGGPIATGCPKGVTVHGRIPDV